jgi:hypothetical protein
MPNFRQDLAAREFRALVQRQSAPRARRKGDDRKRLAITTLAALGALSAAAPGALADDFTCSGIYTSPTTVDGNLFVPANTNCTFEAPLTVTGNVTVAQGASFVIFQLFDLSTESTIGGNLQASNCAYVELNPGSTQTTLVGGNVQIQNCTGKGNLYHSGEAFGDRGPHSMIMGDFQCNNNTGACFLENDTVGGNVQLYNNVSPGTPSVVAHNTIMKNLQCQNNSPTPTNGGMPNHVVGNPDESSEGQCKGF